MLVGWKVHDLTGAMARNEAQDGWLTENQYLAILSNPNLYPDLMQQHMGAEIDNILAGTEECFFMCPDNVDDGFAYDVTAETSGVMFGTTWRMTLKSSYSRTYEKREYTMRGGGDLKIVHYQPHNDADKIDKIKALEEANNLNEEIENHGASSSQTKAGILQRIRGRRGGGRGRDREGSN